MPDSPICCIAIALVLSFKTAPRVFADSDSPMIAFDMAFMAWSSCKLLKDARSRAAATRSCDRPAAWSLVIPMPTNMFWLSARYPLMSFLFLPMDFANESAHSSTSSVMP